MKLEFRTVDFCGCGVKTQRAKGIIKLITCQTMSMGIEPVYRRLSLKTGLILFIQTKIQKTVTIKTLYTLSVLLGNFSCQQLKG